MSLNSDLSYPGVSFPGRQKIADIFNELQRQAKCYCDYIVKTTNMRLEICADSAVLHFQVGSAWKSLNMSRRALLQLYTWIGLPLNSRLYKRLVTGYDDDQGKQRDRFWPTLCQMINDHFTILAAKKLIRTLQRPDGNWYVRALLSDRYRIIPNDQLFLAVADKLKQVNAEVWDARLSEDAFYLYAVAPGIGAQVRGDRPFKVNDRWLGDAGDAVNAAFMLKNSETGQGGCEVCPAVVTKVTRSYLVQQNSLSIRHLGGMHALDAMLSAQTIQDMNQIVYKQVRDYCTSTFDPDKFQEIIDKLNDATQDELADPVKAAEAVRIVFDLSEERRDAITKWLIDSGDKSRYGLSQAVAREAGENAKLGPDEATNLEQVSAQLVTNFTSVQLARAWKLRAEVDANKDALKASKRVKELSVAGATVNASDLEF